MSLQSEVMSVETMFKKMITLMIPSYVEIERWNPQKEQHLLDILNITKHAKEENSDDHLEHFLGTLVLKRDRKTSRIIICDGHHRVLTIYIMLIAIYHHLRDLNRPKAQALSELIYHEYLLNLFEVPFIRFTDPKINTLMFDIIQQKVSDYDDHEIVEIYDFFQKFFKEDTLSDLHHYVCFVLAAYINIVTIQTESLIICI